MSTKYITAFKIINWFDKKKMSVFYGIDGKVDGRWYHLTDDGRPLFFDNKKDANAKMREMRKDETERQGVMTLRGKEPKGKTLNLR